MNSEFENFAVRESTESYTLLNPGRIYVLEDMIDVVRQNAVATEIYFENDDDTLTKAYAETVSTLRAISGIAESMIDEATGKYRTRKAL